MVFSPRKCLPLGYSKASKKDSEVRQAGKVARMGYLSVATADGDKMLVAAFRQALREHGYVEGKNVVIEVRHAAQRLEALPALAAELVSLKIDVAVVWGFLQSWPSGRCTARFPS